MKDKTKRGRGGPADNYRNKRVKYSVKMYCTGLDSNALLWIRVDSSRKGAGWYNDPAHSLNFAMDKDGVCGGNNRYKSEAALDVPAGAGAITFGVSLYWDGPLSVNGMEFKVVPKAGPETRGEKEVPDAPVNPL